MSTLKNNNITKWWHQEAYLLVPINNPAAAGAAAGVTAVMAATRAAARAAARTAGMAVTQTFLDLTA